LVGSPSTFGFGWLANWALPRERDEAVAPAA
jgi:hypothetical protein